MKKICLSVIGLYLTFLSAFAQTGTESTTGYKSKPLKVDEINLVESYYKQDGNHSPVTGGIGTEKVTDLSNGLEVKWLGYDASGNKHELMLGMGIDHHSSASAAFVSKTGASKTDGNRIYPSLSWTKENEAKGTQFGLGGYYSYEYNYQSLGMDMHMAAKTKNGGEFNAKVSGFFDKVKLILPSELIPVPVVNTNTAATVTSYTTASGRTVYLSSGGTVIASSSNTIPSSPRNTFTASLSFAQIINKRMQVSIATDLVAQHGYLGLPFHRVYFTDGTEKVENLPDNRMKVPIGIRLNYFLGDNIIIRSYYRFYTDNWGITAHTASLEIPYKFTPFFSLSPFFRWYTQTASPYFAAYGKHSTSDQYFTSNYAYSAFTSYFMGLGSHIAPPKGIFNTHLSTLEIRYGHYTQSTDLYSNVLSFAFTFK